MKKFSELCVCVKDQCHPTTSGASVYIGLEHIDGGAFFLNRQGKPSDVQSAKTRFRKDDVLYGKLRPYLDKAVIAPCDGICSTDILAFRPNENNCAAYLLGLIHTAEFRTYAGQTTNGVNHPRTSWHGLADFSWDVPPKPEQEKIAAVLWKVQRAIEVEEKLVAATRELKQSAMRQLFTHGLRSDPHHDTELGPLPKSWSAVPLGSLGRIGNGSTPLKTNPAYWTNGTIPWLTSAKVYDVTVTKADQFVTPLAVGECHLPRVKPGSVLIAITGQGKTLGNAAVTAIETCVSQHIAFVAFTDDSANPHFIRLFLESRYAELRGVGQGGGSTKGALTCGFLKTFLIPCPEIAEQDEIATALMTIEAKISVHERKRAALSDLFQTLLHQLMTAQIRVDKLDIDTSEVAA